MAGHSIGTTHYRRRLDGLVGTSNLSKKIDIVLAAAYKDKDISVEQYKSLRVYANNKLINKSNDVNTGILEQN